MSFGQPLWFWAFLLLLPLTALFMRNERQRSMLLRRLIAARLEAQLAGSVSLVRRRLRFAVLLLALACVILALAQPRHGYILEEHKTHGRDVLIAIDCSKSMLANDVLPSRLQRAKLAAEDLIGQLAGDRVGVIAFAGTAFLQAPLTADHNDVLTALRELDTEIIPRGGTDIAEAIRTATDAFGKGESDDRALILFTDGEELEESGVEAARALKGTVRIFTVGVGTADGTVLTFPGANGEPEYVKDPDGQVVKSRLDESRLQEIAQETNGFYVHLLSGPAEMQQIFRDGLKPMSEHDLDSQYARRPIERYQWPLGAGMLLMAGSLLIGERKRAPARGAGAASAVAALFLLAAWPGTALGKNEGVEAYDREDYKGALDSFDLQLKKRPENETLNFDLGSAAYKTGDLDRAMEGFSSAVTSSQPALREKAEYNLGNTLFQRGVKLKEKPAELTELRNALQHYEAALKVQPQDANAQFNRDAVKNLIAELEKEPPKQDQQQQQKKDQQKQDQQKDQKDQKNQQQQGQKQDQQQKQGQQSKDQQSQPQQGQGQKQDQRSSGGQGQQKDQKDQQGEQKDSQQAGKQGDQQKDQKQGDSKEQQQQAKAGEQKEQKDKGENGQPQEPKDSKDGKSGEQQQAQQPASAGQDQQQEQRKLAGDLKDAGQPQTEGEKQAAQQQAAEQKAAEEARAAAENRLTEEQARNLLESLRSDDRRVQLLNPKGRKDVSGKFRDW